MNATQLLAHFDRLAEAPGAVPRLRRFILDLAVRGKLVEQDEGDEPAAELLTRIQAEKARLLTKPVKKVELLPSEIIEQAGIDIPSGWDWSKLGTLCTKTGSGSTPAGGKSAYPESGVPFLRSQNVYDDGLRMDVVAYISEATHARMSTSTVKAADLLLNITGGSIGRCAVVPETFAVGNINQHVAIIRLALPECGRFVHSVICSDYFQGHIFGNQTGAGREGLPKNRMDEILIPIPPLAEQHRIVAKVDELMALCDQLEAAQQERERRRDRLAAASLQRLNQPAAATNPETQREHARFHLHHLPRLTTGPEHIKAMRQTILNFAVHGWLVPQGSIEGPAAIKLQEALASRKAAWDAEQVAKARATGKALAKDWQKRYLEPIHEEGLFDLPPEWVWASSLEICECVENGNTPSPHEMTDGDGEIPFIKVYNLTKTGELDFTVKPTFITRQVHEQKLQRSRISPGDVLMNIVGPPLGKVSLVTDQFPEWNTNQAVVLFRPSEVLLPKYLTLCLLSDAVLTWITRLAQATVGQSNISVSKSRALPIPLPPLPEQHRIVAKVDELMALCDQLEAQLTTTQTDSRRLLEAVLEVALVPS